MKKILTFIATIMMVVCVSAQNFEKDYTYGFWSNWSAGMSVQMTKSFNNNWTLGQGTNIGAELRAQKQIGQHWDLRLIADVPGFFSSDSAMFDRYGTALVGFSWTPWKYAYVFADGGIGSKRDSYGWLVLAADAGIGAKVNVWKHSTIFGEIGVDCIGDITQKMLYNNAFVKVGWMYNFGLTKTDKDILEQRRVLAETKALESVCDTTELVNRLNRCKKQEVELIRKIEILENHDVVLTEKLANMSRMNDSLAKVIESIKDDQINYYALPFSVLFENDSYVISDDQMNKIKAVASIMKDDTTKTYNVIGFCDKTGSPEYNKKLSEKRAEAVKKVLMRYGVKEEQITVSGNGYETPFSDGKLSVNRRVSFYRNF